MNKKNQNKLYGFYIPVALNLQTSMCFIQNSPMDYSLAICLTSTTASEQYYGGITLVYILT